MALNANFIAEEVKWLSLDEKISGLILKVEMFSPICHFCNLCLQTFNDSEQQSSYSPSLTYENRLTSKLKGTCCREDTSINHKCFYAGILLKEVGEMMPPHAKRLLISNLLYNRSWHVVLPMEDRSIHGTSTEVVYHFNSYIQWPWLGRNVM